MQLKNVMNVYDNFVVIHINSMYVKRMQSISRYEERLR